MRLLVLEKYKGKVLGQYHDGCGHWGIEETLT